MAFDLERFYRELDEKYAAHNNDATEQFLIDRKNKAYEEGTIPIVNDSCPSCVPQMEPNWNYISVCNELACFYRGLSRFQESLETFSLAQKELESLYQQNTSEYATVLLNKAGTYRYMGDLERALEHFKCAAKILEQEPKQHIGILSGLYNNMGLVYLDLNKPQDAIAWLQKALPLVTSNPNMTTELGSTWNNLAAAYQALNQMNEAKEAIEHAIEILGKLDQGVNPHYPAALNTRGTFYYHAGEYELALTDFKEALEKTKLVYGENVEYAYGCDNCATVCGKLGRDEEAKEWREKGKKIREQLDVQN